MFLDPISNVYILARDILWRAPFSSASLTTANSRVPTPDSPLKISPLLMQQSVSRVLWKIDGAANPIGAHGLTAMCTTMRALFMWAHKSTEAVMPVFSPPIYDFIWLVPPWYSTVRFIRSVARFRSISSWKSVSQSYHTFIEEKQTPCSD